MDHVSVVTLLLSGRSIQGRFSTANVHALQIMKIPRSIQTATKFMTSEYSGADCGVPNFLAGNHHLAIEADINRQWYFLRGQFGSVESPGSQKW